MIKKSKIQDIIIICSLSGIIILLLVFMGVKIFSMNPEKQASSEIKFVYNFITEKYNSDKEKDNVKEGKYTSISLYKDGKSLLYVAEFDPQTDKLTHLCVSNGTRKTDLNYKDITLDYIEKYSVPKRSNEKCEFN